MKLARCQYLLEPEFWATLAKEGSKRTQIRFGATFASRDTYNRLGIVEGPLVATKVEKAKERVTVGARNRKVSYALKDTVRILMNREQV